MKHILRWLRLHRWIASTDGVTMFYDDVEILLREYKEG